MRILITGGAGFIGSALAKELINKNHDVTIVDNFFTGNINNLDHTIKNITFRNIDLSDETNIQELDNLLSNIDVVYHFAASIGVKLVYEKPAETLQNSFKINNNLFPIFEKHQVKVIFSSTSEIYGETINEDGSKETDILKIFSPGKPRGSYACAKLMSEFLLKSYTFPNIIVRFFNVVGPGQVGDYGHVLPRFINAAVNNKSLEIYGDGSQIRSYCDIRDAVQMLILLLNHDHNNEIYNIGNDNNILSLNELAATILTIIDSISDVKHISFEDAYNSSFEEIYKRFPNTDKIKKYYKCKYSTDDIIRNIYETNFSSCCSS
mgnify:CR=1 FL=1